MFSYLYLNLYLTPCQADSGCTVDLLGKSRIEQIKEKLQVWWKKEGRSRESSNVIFPVKAGVGGMRG